MSKTKNNCQVFHFDLYGKRDAKYDFLNENSLSSINWNKLEPNEPNFFLVKKDFDESGEYEKGIKIDELFKLNASGIKTQRDDASIFITKVEKNNLIFDLKNLNENEIKIKYKFIDVRDWKVGYAKNDVIENELLVEKVLYRPFDYRFSIYTGKTKGIMGYPRYNIMQHIIEGKNYGLVTCRIQNFDTICHITNKVSDIRYYSNPGSIGTDYVFPLYLYPEKSTQQSLLETSERVPNLNMEFVNKIADHLSCEFIPDDNIAVEFNAIDFVQPLYPLDILDYIYAVLHSPKYRETYKEFLKIDFPRVPYPTDADKFWKLVEIGTQIRELHLLESPITENYITGYPEDGDNVVGKIRFELSPLSVSPQGEKVSLLEEGLREVKLGKVFINETQYFSDVPEIAWNFYIGGYQPAQKWLKDRKDRELSYEDILHYQKIIVALTETDRLMKEVDEIGVL